ncbi:hypothetical protein H8N03_02315 [Ramlibacter sp. USB13]|uniref:Uncharacterized protein n=1 Tax=Ramlibacter cellulosilyticus TaxID=2764187 RepID=A0A923MLU8_9BURK|nr:hypothetical protein [Ramlibacter cellulosilyticus]MBC5781760.1 hypothetical protein [Ramlibacter cellulosilyticus]
MAGNEDAIRDMLQRFAHAFTTGDGAGAAACWQVPALVVSAEGNRAVASLEEVGAFFGGARAQYNAQGVTGTRVDVQRIAWHTPALASVTVRWPYLDGEGREVGRSEASCYVVHVAGDDAKISVAILLGEA